MGKIITGELIHRPLHELGYINRGYLVRYSGKYFAYDYEGPPSSNKSMIKYLPDSVPVVNGVSKDKKFVKNNLIDVPLIKYFNKVYFLGHWDHLNFKYYIDRNLTLINIKSIPFGENVIPNLAPPILFPKIGDKVYCIRENFERFYYGKWYEIEDVSNFNFCIDGKYHHAINFLTEAEVRISKLKNILCNE